MIRKKNLFFCHYAFWSQILSWTHQMSITTSTNYTVNYLLVIYMFCLFHFIHPRVLWICTWLDIIIHRLLMYTLYVYASSIDFYPWHLALWLSFLFKIILDLGINQTNVYIQKSQKTFILRIPWLFIPKHIFAMASLIGRQSKNVYKNEHFIRSDFFVII